MSDGKANHWDAPLYLRCSCHTAYHAVVIERDEDIAGYANVSVISTRNGSVWHRIKWALKHVFGREDLVLADLILEPDAVGRLRDFCATILEPEFETMTFETVTEEELIAELEALAPARLAEKEMRK